MKKSGQEHRLSKTHDHVNNNLIEVNKILIEVAHNYDNNERGIEMLLIPVPQLTTHKVV